MYLIPFTQNKISFIDRMVKESQKNVLKDKSHLICIWGVTAHAQSKGGGGGYISSKINV